MSPPKAPGLLILAVLTVIIAVLILGAVLH